MSAISYQVHAESLIDSRLLADEWCSLETRSRSSFFLSWSWVQIWLDVYKPDANIIKVLHGGSIVAMALFVRRKSFRYGCIPITTLHFHETGDSLKDQIWSEYNGVLIDSEHPKAIDAMFDYLAKNPIEWDELDFGVVERATIFNKPYVKTLICHQVWAAPTYSVNLAALRDSGTEYLSTLSKNTRNQIRRTQRILESRGAIVFEASTGLAQAQTFFESASTLHLQRWGHGVGESGFANKYFVEFHQELIRRESGSTVQLFRLTAAGEVLGYFYYFVFARRVYFYLSALEEFGENKIKPGLLGHTLAIEYFIKRGDLDCYDFMGGEARYKESLARKDIDLVRIRLQKPRLKFKVVRFARECRQKIIDRWAP